MTASIILTFLSRSILVDSSSITCVRTALISSFRYSISDCSGDLEVVILFFLFLGLASRFENIVDENVVVVVALVC